jgi:hypothetical protein
MSRSLPRLLGRSALVAALAAAAFAVGSPGQADAATYEVTDASDNAATPNTLRWAIAQANADAAPPTIEIAPGLEIDLTCAAGGSLGYDSVADHRLIIHANGATITQTCAGDPVLNSATEDLSVYDATITGGQLGGILGGGDVYVEGSVVEANTGGPGINTYSGHASIYRSALRDNAGGSGGGVGAIQVDVVDSTVSDNRGSRGAGIWGDQMVTVTNSTVTGNDASISGGGVYSGLNDIRLHHATVVGNTAPVGANVDIDSGSQLTSFASLIGEPQGGGDNCDLHAMATVVSHDFNVTSDASCGLDVGAADLVDTDPMVGALADNGGPTQTRLPADDSPAVDRADCQPLVVDADQRGVSRPQGPACDSGAVEVEPDPGSDGTPAGAPTAPAVPVALEPRFTG